MLDLSPEIGPLLEQEAASEGVSIDTLIRRVLVRNEKPTQAAPPSRSAARVQNLLTEWQ